MKIHLGCHIASSFAQSIPLMTELGGHLLFWNLNDMAHFSFYPIILDFIKKKKKSNHKPCWQCVTNCSIIRAIIIHAAVHLCNNNNVVYSIFNILSNFEHFVWWFCFHSFYIAFIYCIVMLIIHIYSTILSCIHLTIVF